MTRLLLWFLKWLVDAELSNQISQSKNTDDTEECREKFQRQNTNLPLHTHPDIVSKSVRVRVPVPVCVLH